LNDEKIREQGALSGTAVAITARGGVGVGGRSQKKVRCSEGTQVMPARPTGKCRFDVILTVHRR